MGISACCHLGQWSGNCGAELLAQEESRTDVLDRANAKKRATRATRNQHNHNIHHNNNYTCNNNHTHHNNNYPCNHRHHNINYTCRNCMCDVGGGCLCCVWLWSCLLCVPLGCSCCVWWSLLCVVVSAVWSCDQAWRWSPLQCLVDLRPLVTALRGRLPSPSITPIGVMIGLGQALIRACPSCRT